MSFLESIQHGLEKASQEAARITRIQHLHNISNDLTFKASQQGQALIVQAMDMYHNGHLGQGELVAICQQIATYQQQISEVQAELQRLRKPEDHAGEQAAPVAPSPTSYPAYPQATPPQAYAAGDAPTSYLPPQPSYPAQSPAYPAPAAPAVLGTSPVQQEYPVPASTPAQPVAPDVPASGEPPTRPATHTQSAVNISSEATQ